MSPVAMLKIALLLPALTASIRSHEDLNEIHHLSQATVAKQAEKEEPFPELDDECAVVENAVRRNSAWRRTNKCKCPEGEMLQCPLQDCEVLGRYFKAANVKELGCHCRKDCVTECGDVVAGAVWRKSSWRRSNTGTTCKCPVGQIIAGSQGCTNHAASAANPRHFAKGQLRDMGCGCVPDPLEDEAGPPSGGAPARPPAGEAPNDPEPPVDQEPPAPPAGPLCQQASHECTTNFKQCAAAMNVEASCSLLDGAGESGEPADSSGPCGGCANGYQTCCAYDAGCACHVQGHGEKKEPVREDQTGEKKGPNGAASRVAGGLGAGAAGLVAVMALA